MPEKRKTFISFSYEDRNQSLVDEIKKILTNKNIIVDLSEKEDRSEFANETIWKHLEARIKKCSITIVLLTTDLFEGNNHKLNYYPGSFIKSGWIYNEISASLRNWDENKINGIIAIYEPGAKKYILNKNHSTCMHCYNSEVQMIKLKNEILIKNMFNVNRQLKINKNCDYFDSYNDHFISLVSLSDFKNNPSKYVENAFEKRRKQIESDNSYFNIEYNFHKVK